MSVSSYAFLLRFQFLLLLLYIIQRSSIYYSIDFIVVLLIDESCRRCILNITELSLLAV